MPAPGTQTSESEKPSDADRIVDAVQHAAHGSQEARLVKWHECDAVARTECRSSSDRAAQRRAVELRQRAGWSLRWARGQRLRRARRRSICGVVRSGLSLAPDWRPD